MGQVAITATTGTTTVVQEAETKASPAGVPFDLCGVDLDHVLRGNTAYAIHDFLPFESADIDDTVRSLVRGY